MIALHVFWFHTCISMIRLNKMLNFHLCLQQYVLTDISTSTRKTKTFIILLLTLVHFVTTVCLLVHLCFCWNYRHYCQDYACDNVRVKTRLNGWTMKMIFGIRLWIEWSGVWALAGDIVLCSWARHFTLTVPLFAQVYKWVLANCLGKLTNCRGVGGDLWWTSIPSRGSRNTSSRFMLQKPG